MSTTLTLVKSGNRLSPADAWSDESLDAIKNGDTVFVTISYPRNLKHHRKLFALFGTIYKVQERYATRKQLLSAIKVGAGYYDDLPITIGGVEFVIKVPKSIDFESMKQGDFVEFYEKALHWIITDLVPGLSSEDLENQVLEALA